VGPAQHPTVRAGPRLAVTGPGRLTSRGGRSPQRRPLHLAQRGQAGRGQAAGLGARPQPGASGGQPVRSCSRGLHTADTQSRMVNSAVFCGDSVLAQEATDASTSTVPRLPAIQELAARSLASSGFLVGRPIGAARIHRHRPGSRRRRQGRFWVTRRRRTDHRLMIIVRRAERDAGMHTRSRLDESDIPTAINQGCRSDETDSQHPS
jgi:hypothetical protein